MGWMIQIVSLTKNIKRHRDSIIWVIKMAITLETIHRDIQQVKADLHRLLYMLDDEGILTDEARLELKKAREEMACGVYVGHEMIMEKYG
jgi:iron-sulfur cluster repair protein YtfE (RIC family)